MSTDDKPEVQPDSKKLTEDLTDALVPATTGDNESTLPCLKALFKHVSPSDSSEEPCEALRRLLKQVKLPQHDDPSGIAIQNLFMVSQLEESLSIMGENDVLIYQASAEKYIAANETRSPPRRSPSCRLSTRASRPPQSSGRHDTPLRCASAVS